MTNRSSAPRLALVTPARNEGAFIEDTIRSVIQQTVLPVRWVIVSDGSSDNTAAIVRKYSDQHSWIELVNVPPHAGRNFAGKVHAFNLGYARLQNVEYEMIGNLDADITFDEGYFEFLLGKFVLDSQLGVAGTPFTEDDRQYDYRFTSTAHVSGACQLFSRRCFEDIGGYTPISIGGVDLVAVLTARMKGWKTKSFCEKTCQHHRKMGTAKQRRLMVAFKGGRGDYKLGTHFFWEAARTPYQMTRQPILLGGLLRLTGFCWSMIAGDKLVVSSELAAFRKQEQMTRLREFLTKLARSGAARSPEACVAQSRKA